jgi:hypothetical protein
MILLNEFLPSSAISDLPTRRNLHMSRFISSLRSLSIYCIVFLAHGMFGDGRRNRWTLSFTHAGSSYQCVCTRALSSQGQIDTDACIGVAPNSPVNLLFYKQRFLESKNGRADCAEAFWRSNSAMQKGASYGPSLINRLVILWSQGIAATGQEESLSFA